MSVRQAIALAAAGLVVLLGVAAYVWRADIHEAMLKPPSPFQTWKPPPPPDYATVAAWAALPAQPAAPSAGDPPADVFFVHPTTFDGGADWNAAIDAPEPRRLLHRIALPNYAGPFRTVGRVFAPRYRQASLYTLLTARDDAREARAFAYDDVAAAFGVYMARYNLGRPVVVVGVEQGGFLAERLVAEMNETQRRRLVAAYLIETAVPAERPPLPPCASRTETGCLLAWISNGADQSESVQERLRHSLVWAGDRAVLFAANTPVCVNPVTGVRDSAAGVKAHLGGANASKLELETRPAFLAHQVETRCQKGVLEVSRPRSASLRPSGSWAEQARTPGFNLFYADLEADAQGRVAEFTAKP